MRPVRAFGLLVLSACLMSAPAAFAAPQDSRGVASGAPAPSKQRPTSAASQKKTNKNTKARKPKTAPRPESAPSTAAAAPAVTRTTSSTSSTSSTAATATTKTTAGAPESSDSPGPGSSDPVATEAKIARGPTPLRTAGYVGVGAGVLALGTGAVLGIMAANERSELSARCPNDVCSSADRAAYDRGHAQADAATLVIAAGALVTAGSVALIVFGGSKKESDPSAASTLSARLRAGPTGVFVSGTFQ